MKASSVLMGAMALVASGAVLSASTIEVTITGGTSLGDDAIAGDNGIVFIQDVFEDYAGWEVIEIGYRDLEINVFETSHLWFGWRVVPMIGGFPPLGTIFEETPMAFSDPGTYFIDEFSKDAPDGEWYVPYQPAAPPGTLGGVVWATVEDDLSSSNTSLPGAFEIVSGEWYYVLSDPVPAPGALALLGLGAMVSRRRRRN